MGIDDWAWRKGQRYGTIVVDLERGDVIDLLPDRDAETVAAWLKDHPGVEVVSRDRSAAYAQAATEGASKAEQVADRWHLLKNLREAVERVLERHSAVVDAALKTSEAPFLPHATEGQMQLQVQLIQIQARQIPHLNLLQVPPQPFHRVQGRRVRRQRLQTDRVAGLRHELFDLRTRGGPSGNRHPLGVDPNPIPDTLVPGHRASGAIHAVVILPAVGSRVRVRIANYRPAVGAPCPRMPKLTEPDKTGYHSPSKISEGRGAWMQLKG